MINFPPLDKTHKQAENKELKPNLTNLEHTCTSPALRPCLGPYVCVALTWVAGPESLFSWPVANEFTGL